MNRFNFTGELRLNSLDSRNPYNREGKTKSGIPYMAFSAAIVSDVNNRAFLELFGMDSDEIKTIDTDGNKIAIGKDDRFDEEVVSSVANYRKNVVNIGDRKEFINAYDAVTYLCDNADEINGKKVTVTGQIDKNIYNGAISDRFQIQNIYLADDDRKNALNTTVNLVFNKESVDIDDWKSEHKIYINGFTSTYIAEKKTNKYVPQRIVLDCSKINFSNEKHVKLVTFKAKMIGCSVSETEAKCMLKTGKWYNLILQCRYVNGAEVEEFTPDMLTDAQREQYELGLKTLDQLRPSGNIYGNRVTEYKMVDADLKGNFENGMIEIDLDGDDFYTIAKPETIEQLEEVVKEIEIDDSDDEFEDLFA